LKPHEACCLKYDDAEFIELPGVSHFASLQRPEQFNTAMLAFLGKVLLSKKGR